LKILSPAHSVKKGKGSPSPYSYASVDLIMALARTWHIHKPSRRLLLLSARPAVTSWDHHCPLAGTKLYCLVIEAHVCEQLAQSRYLLQLWYFRRMLKTILFARY